MAVSFAVSALGLGDLVGLNFDPLLSHEVLLFVFVPAVVFQGAATVEFDAFRRYLPVFGSVVLLGLPLAVVVLGLLGTRAFALPLAISLLFAATIYPIDPVAVLALYDEMGAPERLAVITEGESLLDDGIAIVLFSALFDLVVRTGGVAAGAVLLSPIRLGRVVADIVAVSAGGVLVGATTGYVVYWMQHRTADRLSVFLLSLVAAYGSFYLAEHVVGVSGVLASVTAGLLLGTRARDRAFDAETLAFVESVWEALAFLLNTVVFVVIGVETPATQLFTSLADIALATALVLGVRAVVVYLVTGVVNQFVEYPVPLNYRHVLVWSGLHGVIPVVLALSLTPAVPGYDYLRTLVFGVVVASMLVQGLLMPRVLRVTGVTETGDDGQARPTR